jgi:hypothetical protein
MTEALYVARHAGEVAPTLDLTTPGVVVGGSDALATSDGDTSYSSTLRGGGVDAYQQEGVTFRWSAVTALPAGATVDSVTFDAVCKHGDRGNTTTVALNPVLSNGVTSWQGIRSPGAGDYLTVSFAGPTSGTGLDSITSPSAVWTLLTGDPAFAYLSDLRVTHLTCRIVYTGGAQPLRLMQRGDGLGMGSGRVYGTGTRQASTRVFGSL